MATVLGVLPEVRGLREQIVKELPSFDVAQLNGGRLMPTATCRISSASASADRSQKLGCPPSPFEPEFVTDLFREEPKLMLRAHSDASALLPKRLRRSELSRTETLDSDIAALASTGDSVQPVSGYSKPAAMGIPITL